MTLDQRKVSVRKLFYSPIQRRVKTSRLVRRVLEVKLVEKVGRCREVSLAGSFETMSFDISGLPSGEDVSLFHPSSLGETQQRPQIRIARPTWMSWENSSFKFWKRTERSSRFSIIKTRFSESLPVAQLLTGRTYPLQ